MLAVTFLDNWMDPICRRCELYCCKFVLMFLSMVDA